MSSTKMTAKLCVEPPTLNSEHDDDDDDDDAGGGGCIRGTQHQFSENISSEDDLRSRIFGTFVVKFLACLPLLGFSNI